MQEIPSKKQMNPGFAQAVTLALKQGYKGFDGPEKIIAEFEDEKGDAGIVHGHFLFDPAFWKILNIPKEKVLYLYEMILNNAPEVADAYLLKLIEEQ